MTQPLVDLIAIKAMESMYTTLGHALSQGAALEGVEEQEQKLLRLVDGGQVWAARDYAEYLKKSWEN